MTCDCPECQELRDDICANAEVLRALRDEPVPLRRSKPIAWRVAVAAAVLIPVLLLPFRHKPVSNEPVAALAQPLRIKMLTGDPNVVIYWLVDSKEDK